MFKVSLSVGQRITVIVGGCLNGVSELDSVEYTFHKKNIIV